KICVYFVHKLADLFLLFSFLFLGEFSGSYRGSCLCGQFLQCFRAECLCVKLCHIRDGNFFPALYAFVNLRSVNMPVCFPCAYSCSLLLCAFGCTRGNSLRVQSRVLCFKFFKCHNLVIGLFCYWWLFCR